jgi:hypothetical protein
MTHLKNSLLFVQSFGKLVNITQDPMKGTIWAFTEKTVFRYKIIREERNVWQVRIVLEVRSLAQSCEVRCCRIDYEGNGD